jgi:xanthine dehydrogenase accessory factor
MTCGGQAEVLVEPLDGSFPATRDFYGEALALLRRGGRGCLVTAISEEGAGIAVEHFLGGGGACAAVSVAGRTLPTEILASAVSVPTLVESGAVRYFLDPLTPPITVVVFGGGHIAARLVPLCHGLGFRTVVVDDRADFASRDRFPQADELLTVPSFENALQDLPLDAGHYVVIVTRGHGGDQAILRQALRRRPAYIGMIGSRRKRGLIFEALAREGVGADDLARVVCPIGLPIGAETPEEIAISIAAELVAIRAARTGRGAAR